MTSDIPSPDITVDGTGLLCVALLLRLRKEIDGASRASSSTSSPPTEPHRSTCPPVAI